MEKIKNTVIILAIVFADIATQLFKNFPEDDEFWITSDGTSFRKENYAINHAAYLEDKKVEHVTREEYGPVPKAKKEKEGKEKEAPKANEGEKEGKEKEAPKANEGEKEAEPKEEAEPANEK